MSNDWQRFTMSEDKGLLEVRFESDDTIRTRPNYLLTNCMALRECVMAMDKYNHYLGTPSGRGMFQI